MLRQNKAVIVSLRNVNAVILQTGVSTDKTAPFVLADWCTVGVLDVSISALRNSFRDSGIVATEIFGSAARGLRRLTMGVLFGR